MIIKQDINNVISGEQFEVLINPEIKIPERA